MIFTVCCLAVPKVSSLDGFLSGPHCCQTYPLQRTRRAWLALSPGRVLLGQVPFGESPSPHHLRRQLPSLVRRLHSYFGAVRLSGLVHRRRMSLDFPTRPAAPSTAGEPRPPGSRARCFHKCTGSQTARTAGPRPAAGLRAQSKARCARIGSHYAPVVQKLGKIFQQFFLASARHNRARPAVPRSIQSVPISPGSSRSA